MRIKDLLLLLLLVCSVILWRWYSAEEEVAEPVQAELPDFVATRLYSATFDKEGKLAFRIFADSMRYYELQERTQFSRPVVLVYPEQVQPVWQLSAEEGILTMEHPSSAEESLAQDEPGDGSDNNVPARKPLKERLQVTLSDQVNFVNLTNSEYVRSVTSDSISLNLKTQEITTDDKVTVSGPHYQLSGVGLEGNLKEEQVTLLNEVHGDYYSTEEE